MEEKSKYLTPKTEAGQHTSAESPEPSAGLQETSKQGAVDTLEDRAATQRALTGWRNELEGTG